jgi:FixJ family two-component response regulator
MGGVVLADRLRRMQPDLKVLFISGCTDNAMVHHGILDRGTPFIQKPFSIRDLPGKVREAPQGGRKTDDEKEEDSDILHHCSGDGDYFFSLYDSSGP